MRGDTAKGEVPLRKENEHAGPQTADGDEAGALRAASRDSVRHGVSVVSPGDWRHGRALNTMKVKVSLTLVLFSSTAR